LGDFDSLSSFSAFYYTNNKFTFPSLKDVFSLEATEIGHPMILEQERVCTDIKINSLGQFVLITGSNMAGKSTFLRTIGINMVLAMCGAPVCAKHFSVFPLQLFSSMRIGDDLSNRESTFYAELKRLKKILDEIEKQEVFILLDELLKGTNSKDKLAGSIALIRQLIESKAAGIIATHDLALGELENEYPEKLRNYNFEVDIKNDQFFFDYKLKKGICNILNATELMKSMGLKV